MSCVTDERPQAGWYDDGSGRPRWWDGVEWGQYATVPESIPPSAAPTRRRRGLLIGGIAALLVVVGTGVAASVLLLRGDPLTEVYEEWNTAIETADCGLYERITTESFRDDYAGDDGYSCSSFEELSDPDFLDDFDFEVRSSTTEGTSGTLEVWQSWLEDDGDEGTGDVRREVVTTYGLIQQGGDWLFDTADTPDE